MKNMNSVEVESSACSKNGTQPPEIEHELEDCTQPWMCTEACYVPFVGCLRTRGVDRLDNEWNEYHPAETRTPPSKVQLDYIKELAARLRMKVPASEVNTREQAHRIIGVLTTMSRRRSSGGET